MGNIPRPPPPLHSIPSAAVDQMQPRTTSPCDKRVYVKEQHKTQCSCMCRSIFVMKNTGTSGTSETEFYTALRGATWKQQTRYMTLLVTLR